MERRLLGVTLSAAFIMVSGALGLVFAGNIKAAGKVVSSDERSAVIGVETLMKSPSDYKGKIKVEGVVRAVDAEKKLIALIDRKEYEECKTIKCSLLTLPVKWNGPMPSVQDEVVLQGEIKPVDDVFLFVANSLEKLPPRPSKNDKT